MKYFILFIVLVAFHSCDVSPADLVPPGLKDSTAAMPSKGGVIVGRPPGVPADGEKPAPDRADKADLKIRQLDTLVRALLDKQVEDEQEKLNLKVKIKTLEDSAKSFRTIVVEPPNYLVPTNREGTQFKLIFSSTEPPANILHPVFADQDN